MHLTMQTIRESINRYEKIVPTKPKKTMDKLYETLDLSFPEIATYQTKKSVAFMEGKIDKELAQFLYEKLNRWRTTTLAERITLTQVFAALLK